MGKSILTGRVNAYKNLGKGRHDDEGGVEEGDAVGNAGGIIFHFRSSLWLLHSVQLSRGQAQPQGSLLSSGCNCQDQN